MTHKCRVIRCNEFLMMHDAARYARDYRRKGLQSMTNANLIQLKYVLYIFKQTFYSSLVVSIYTRII